MPSIVEELQANCIDPSVSTVALLRKAKVIAAKLNLAEFERWVDFELNGYPPEGDVPSYRNTMGQVIWLNPYRGWLPVNFGKKAAEFARKLARSSSIQPVGTIKDLLKKAGDSFQKPFDAALAAQICEGMEVDPTQVALRIDRSALAGILDGVRNQILEWSLKLEKAGILGQGISFLKASVARHMSRR